MSKKVYEWCSECEAEVKISSKKASRCPSCGKPIIPCSMCTDEDYVNCQTEKCKFFDSKVKLLREYA